MLQVLGNRLAHDGSHALRSLSVVARTDTRTIAVEKTLSTLLSQNEREHMLHELIGIHLKIILERTPWLYSGGIDKNKLSHVVSRGINYGNTSAI